MKHLLCLAFVLALYVPTAFGQISVRAFHLRPRGEFGFVMKPVNSAEIAYMPRFSRRSTKKLRTGFMLAFMNFKPRMEVFPTTGVLEDGNGTTIIPGTQSFNKFMVFQLSAGSDYAFVHKEKLNVFVGGDLAIGTASIDYASYQPTIISEDYSGGGYLAGVRFRLGVEYNITKAFSVFASAQTQGNFITEPRGVWAANDIGIGVRYSR